MTTTLPNNFITRAPNMADLEAITNLIIACDIADVGEPDFTTDDLLSDWQRPNFNLATDAKVIVTPEGQIIGYTDVSYGRKGMELNPNTNVHPDYRRQGIENYLLQLSETWARQYFAENQSAIPHVIKTVSATNERRQLLEQEGYTAVSHMWRMEIALDKAPPVPVWPEGITMRTFIPGQDEQNLHRVIQEAFQDIGGRIYQPFEDWAPWAFKQHCFDPFLAYIMIDGNEIAGAVLCHIYPNEGWIRQVAVLRPWRGRGLGMQILRLAFGEFYRRSISRVRLDVDTHNATGATRVYERAGMHIVFQLDNYEKKL
ncbi:MAG: GNAT family N-acetyltransferase [Ktedonobacteraceae bacterium]